MAPPPASKWRPYPAYRDSGVEWLGEVPEGWETRRFRHIARFAGGGAPSTTEAGYWDGDIPGVSPKDFGARETGDAEDHISEQGLAAGSSRLIPADAMAMVVRSGILQHTIPVARTLRPVALDQDLKAAMPEPSLATAPYLVHLVLGHRGPFLAVWRKEGAAVARGLITRFLRHTVCDDLRQSDAGAVSWRGGDGRCLGGLPALRGW